MKVPLFNSAERQEYKRKQQQWHDSHYKDYEPPLLRAGRAELYYRTFEHQVATDLLNSSGFRINGNGLRVLFSCIGSGEGLPFWFGSFPIREVVGVDISVEACRLARRVASGKTEHSTFIQADAESLPFADNSFDLAIVHNGLHHLTNPAAGLRELWRVARGAVIVIEPADSKLMPLFLKLGIARSHEDSGNQVIRFHKEDYISFLQSPEVPQVVYRRYFWYEHPFLSEKVLPKLDNSFGRTLTKVALSAVNRLFFFFRTKSTAVILKSYDRQSVAETTEKRREARVQTAAGDISRSGFVENGAAASSRETRY